MVSKQDLELLKQAEVSTIDLVELTDLHIDTNLPIEQRLLEFMEKIKNPYYFKVNGTPIKIEFCNHDQTLNDVLISCFKDKNDVKNILL